MPIITMKSLKKCHWLIFRRLEPSKQLFIIILIRNNHKMLTKSQWYQNNSLKSTQGKTIQTIKKMTAQTIMYISQTTVLIYCPTTKRTINHLQKSFRPLRRNPQTTYLSKDPIDIRYQGSIFLGALKCLEARTKKSKIRKIVGFYPISGRSDVLY